MSTTVDQRVVEMRFDNKHFEQNVATSMSTLDKLKKSLNLEGASKGLEEVGTAAKKCDVSVVGAAAEQVGLKFNALYTIADQALRRITDSAMAAGKKIVSALTIDPVKTGFSEYETQINAIQTILANTESKGTTLEDVNSALDELNAYADKTIYNFTEMTKNIGTFTAAGTDLDTSVKAIQGIANLAAVSGSTSQQASTAMYQLSQAMASGTVKLMDWNSVVNAGMGGQVFQDALKETAKVHGVAIDDIIAKNGSFRESLSEGWLTTEILTDTLEKFTLTVEGAEEGTEEYTKKWNELKESLKAKGYTDAQAEEILKMGKTATEAATKVKTFSQLFDTLKEAAQSGWTQTWEILVGDFEEAKELLTKISDTVGGFINQMSESRNELLENWKVMGGRDDLIQSFANIWEGLLSVLKPIKEAFSEIFPPATAEQLHKVTENFKNFTAKLKLSDKGAANLKRTLKGVFSVLKLAVTIIKAVFSAIGKLFTGVGHLGGGLLEVTAVIGDFLSFIVELITCGNIFEKVFNGIAAVINFVAKIVSKLISGLAKVFDFLGNGLAFPGIAVIVEGLSSIVRGFTGAEDAAGSFKDRVSAAFASAGEALMNNPIFKALAKLWEGIKTLGKIIGNFFGKMFGSLFTQLSNGDFSGFFDIINGFISGGIGIALINFFKSLREVIDDAGGIAGNIKGVLGSIKDSFQAFQNSLNAEAIKKLAIAIAILAAAVLVLSFIDNKKLTDAVAVITMLFLDITMAMSVLGKLNGVPSTFAMAAAMIGLATGVLILSSALKTVSQMNYDEIARGLTGVAGLLVAFAGAMTLMSLGKGTSTAGIFQLIGVALAVKILAGVLLDIADLDWGEMAVGVVGMTAIMALLVGAMKILPLGTKNIAKPFFKFMGQMWLVVTSVKRLAGVLIDLAYLEWDEMAIGLISLTGVTAILVGAMKILPLATSELNTKNLVALSFALLSLSTAILLLVPAIKVFADMNWGELGKVGTVFAVLLGLFEIFAVSLKMINPTSIALTAASILAMSSALLIMSGAMLVFSLMSWEQLAKAGVVLAALVGALALLGVISSFTWPITMIAMAKSMKILAEALTILVVPLAAFSVFNWSMLAKAGVALGGLIAALALLGAISLYADPISMILMATSLIILAKAIQQLIVPFAAFSLLSWGGIVKSLLLLAGALAILGAAALIFKTLGLEITLLAMAASLAVLGAALSLIGIGLGLIGTGIAAFAVGMTALSGSITVFVWSFLEIATLLIEKSAEMFRRWIVSICQIIIEGAPSIAQAIVAIVVSVLDVLSETVVPIVDTLLSILEETLNQVVNYIPGIADSLFQIILALLNSLNEFVPELVEVLLDIVVKILEGVAEKLPELMGVLTELAAGIFEGIGKAMSYIDPGPLLAGIAVVTALILLVKKLKDLKIKDVLNAAKGMAYMAILIAELAAILVIIGGLSSLAGGTALADEAGNLLGAMSIAVIKAIPLFAALAILMATATAMTPLIQPAMVGLAGLSLLIMELWAMLSLFGVIASVPGVIDIVNKGGDILEAIGLAIGRLIGGVVGGIAKGISSAFPAIANDMSAFMENIQPFIEHAGKIDSSVLAGVGYLCGAILLFTATSVINGLVSLLSGGLNMAAFLGSVATIGLAVKMFSDSVTGIDTAAVQAAAGAANHISLAVCAMTGTSILTGIVTVLTCGLNLATYLSSVETLGKAIKVFSDQVQGVDPAVITAAANAAGPLARAVTTMTVASVLSALATFFTGGLNLASYLLSVATIGESVKIFSDKVQGVDPEVIKASVDAANSLTSTVLKMTGASVLTALATFFSGGLNLASYLLSVATVGESVKVFSDKVKGVEPAGITAAADAAGSLTGTVVKMTGASILAGLGAILTGGLSFVTYAAAVKSIGSAVKGFGEQVKDIDPEGIKAAASVADSLTTTVLKMTGVSILSAIGAILTGGISLLTYQASVITIGASIKAFSDEVKGVKPSVITAAAGVANDLTVAVLAMTGASLLSSIKDLLTLGLGDLGYLGAVVTIGAAVAAFYAEVKNVKPTVITSAADAANSLSLAVTAMAGSSLLNSLKDILTLGLGNLGYENAVETIGKAISKFYNKVKNIKPDVTSSAASAARDIAEVVKTMPKDTGKLKDFGTNLEDFGTKLASFFSKAGKITSESVSAGDKAVEAVKAIATIDAGNITSVASAVKDVTKAIVELVDTPSDMISSFKSDFKKLAESGVKAFAKEFEGLEDDMKSAGEKAITKFQKGANGKLTKATEAFRDIAEECAEAITDKVKSFKNAGKALAQGLADGISANSYLAEAKAKAMAEAAEKAAREALDINSPSKVFMEIGEGIPEGMVVGIDNLSGAVKSSVESMSNDSIDGVKNSISRMADVINSDIDAQPTIRPVLDLSDVRNGADSINKMLSSGTSVDVLSNVGAISSLMDQKNQNGANDDVVSAIDKLNKNLENGVGDTYNFGNISASDDSAIAEAVQALVRAAIMERRV